MNISKAELQAMLNQAHEAGRDSMSYVQSDAKPVKLTLQAKDIGPSERAKDSASAKQRLKTANGTLYFDKSLPKGSTITITVK